MGSTNYYNTFIEVAEDCPAQTGEAPTQRGPDKSAANLQYEMLSENPYAYTSDDIFFAVHAIKKDLTEAEMAAEREKFFSKGQPCFRASPLTKRYGWGIHSNAEGKVAMYGRETPEYEKFLQDSALDKKKAMRTKRG